MEKMNKNYNELLSKLNIQKKSNEEISEEKNNLKKQLININF